MSNLRLDSTRIHAVGPIRAIAERVVQEAGEAGGPDEVLAIARDGWPDEVVLATVPARQYADHDDSLTAAAADVAEDMGLDSWQVEARWADEERDQVLVATSAREVLDAVQAAAKCAHLRIR